MADKIYCFGEDNLGPRGGILYCFHCEGCGYGHPFEVCADNTGWKWNGSLDKPTFTPSLLVWGNDESRRCHSYVTDGKIQFLNDSFHGLKGQTVDLPDWDNEIHF